MPKTKTITAINSKGEATQLDSISMLIISCDDGDELEINFGGYKGSDLHILAPSNQDNKSFRQIEIYPGASNQVAIKVTSMKTTKKNS